MTYRKAVQIIEAAGAKPTDLIVDIADFFIYEADIDSDRAHEWARRYAQ